MTNVKETKKLVGEEVVKYIKDGMKVGLGSGSTMYYMVKKLGERIKKEGLNIEGIPTSIQTADWAKEFGVPLTDFSNLQKLDLAIDGADEVDPDLQLIKGGGGALLREKIVAASAQDFYVIVDNSKIVKHLGAFSLPVEIVPFGWEVTTSKIKKLGCQPTLRKRNGNPYITDNGNFVLDCDFKMIEESEKLHKDLICLTGVVETGLFVNMAKKVLIGQGDEVKEIDQKNNNPRD